MYAGRRTHNPEESAHNTFSVRAILPSNKWVHSLVKESSTFPKKNKYIFDPISQVLSFKGMVMWYLSYLLTAEFSSRMVLFWVSQRLRRHVALVFLFSPLFSSFSSSSLCPFVLPSWLSSSSVLLLCCCRCPSYVSWNSFCPFANSFTWRRDYQHFFFLLLFFLLLFFFLCPPLSQLSFLWLL